MADEGAASPALEGAIEGLYEDEGLRSNLSDDEANILLGWGEQQLTAAADPAAAKGAVQATIKAVNGLVGERANLDGNGLAAAIAAVVSSAGGIGDGKALAAESLKLDNATFINKLLPLLTTQASPPPSPATSNQQPDQLIQAIQAAVAKTQAVAAQASQVEAKEIAATPVRTQPPPPASHHQPSLRERLGGWLRRGRR